MDPLALLEAQRDALQGQLADAQAAQREAELQRAYLAGIVAQAPVGMGILRGEHNLVTLANPPMCRMWRHTREELLGRPLFEVLPEAAGQGFEEILAEVRRTAVPFEGHELPVMIPRLDGEGLERVIFNFVYRPLDASRGPGSDILVVATEITAEVLARHALETSHAEFEAMFDSILDGAYLCDDSGMRRANQAGLALLGVDRIEQLQGPVGARMLRYQVREARTGEPVQPGRSPLQRGMAGEVFRQDYLFRLPASEEDRRLRMTGGPIRVGGVITGSVVLSTDVTEQHRALEALQRSEESFRTLVEALPNAVWTADTEGRTLWTNGVLQRVTGLTGEAIRGDGYQILLHPDDAPATLAAWRHALETGTPLELTHRVRQGDGSFRWHLVRGAPARDADGSIHRWIGTSTDIHDQRELHAELQRRHDFERHLVGIVSHDLRSPLGIILLGASGLLESEKPAEWTRRMARRMQSAAERAERMIRDLLDFTQARLGGGIRLERRPADLRAVVSAELVEVEVLYPDRAVALISEGDLQGTWDIDRLTQVVTNLVTNALKYSPAGTPVTVRATGHEGEVELTVHNEGAPIAPERLGRLFEPLQRGTDEIDARTRSVGLGLYIVDAVARAHGGTVGVASAAGSGTTFKVRLPRGPAAPRP